MTKTQDRIAVALGGLFLALVFAAPYAFGDADTGRDLRTQSHTAESYYRETTVVSYRDALDGGEASADLANAAITAVTELTVQGFPNAAISGRFSVAAATVEITCTRWFKDPSSGALTFKSMETTTIVAGSTYTLGGLFVGRSGATFDTQGCDVIKILAADPSLGTVELWAEVY